MLRQDAAVRVGAVGDREEADLPALALASAASAARTSESADSALLAVSWPSVRRTTALIRVSSFSASIAS